MAFAAAADRAPLRQRNSSGASLSASAPESAATNSGLGCMLGKTCHSSNAGFLASDRDRAGRHSSIRRACARRSAPRPCARSGSSRPSSAPRRRHSRRRGTLRTCRRSCCRSTWPPLFIRRSRARTYEPTIRGRTQRSMRRRKFSMSVVEGTLSLFDRRCCRCAVALSLVRLFSEEEAPHLRLGSRLSAPRPVAMGRTLRQTRPSSANASRAEHPHAIHDVLLRDSIDILS